MAYSLFAPIKTFISLSVPAAVPILASVYFSVALGPLEPILLYVLYYDIISWCNKS